MSFKEEYLRQIPAVDRILKEPLLSFPENEDSVSRNLILEAVQEQVSRKREAILAARSVDEAAQIDLSVQAVAAEAVLAVQKKLAPHLRRVINATGTVLHTNLGRAPLAEAAQERLQEIASSYSNLEYSLTSGERGSRYEHVEELLCSLTGAEAAAVVNNNAAAVYLILNTFAAGKDVIVARGQLVEIGGSFRIPEVMKASGARLVEVGTTNKCYISDYAEAVNEETALMLKVHTSNFRVLGFTATVSAGELAELGKRKGVPVVEDLGSGNLVDFTPFGLPEEPLVTEGIASGVDLVTFSGDKLLGGPQAGIILGRKDLVEAVRRNQMARALRIDKLTLAALEGTLRLYREGKARKEIPILRMLTATSAELQSRARSLAEKLDKATGGAVSFACVEGVSYVGGGAMPLTELPGYMVTVSAGELTAALLAKRLRESNPPVIVRIDNDRVILDPRTLLCGEEDLLVKVFAAALAG